MTTRTEPRVEVFALPWPPTANNSKIPKRGGKGMVSTPELRAFQLVASIKLRQQWPQGHPMKPPYDVLLVFCPPKNVSRFDLGNYEKAPLDALTKAGVIEDDSKIAHQEMFRGEKTGPGQVLVQVSEINPVECEKRLAKVMKVWY